MIRPGTCRVIKCRPIRWVKKNVPVTLIVISAFHSALVISTALRRRLAPALLTSTSMRPKRSIVLVTAASRMGLRQGQQLLASECFGNFAQFKFLHLAARGAWQVF